MNTIVFDNLICPIIRSWKDSEWGDQHHEILYKNEIKVLFESSFGIGEVINNHYSLDNIFYYSINNNRHHRHHRDHAPAVYGKTFQHWYKNGKLHREDGPAIILKDGRKEYYLNDREYTFEKYELEIKERLKK